MVISRPSAWAVPIVLNCKDKERYFANFDEVSTLYYSTYYTVRSAFTSLTYYKSLVLWDITKFIELIFWFLVWLYNLIKTELSKQELQYLFKPMAYNEMQSLSEVIHLSVGL